MADSSDCTHVVKQKNAEFQGTVLDDAIDTKSVQLVKVDTITPHKSEAGQITLEDIIVLDDDRVVLLVQNNSNRGKLLQLFTREFEYLHEIDISSEVTVGSLAKTSANSLVWLDTQEDTSRSMRSPANLKITIQFCSITGDALNLVWKGQNLTLPDNPCLVDRNASYAFTNHLVFNGNIFGTLCWYSDSSPNGVKPSVVLFNKEGEFTKRIALQSHSESQDYRFQAYTHIYDGLNFFALDNGNSRVYFTSFPRHIQCYSYFGVLVWQIEDMTNSPGIQLDRVVLGVAHVGNKLCCYLRGNELVTVDTMTKKIKTVKMDYSGNTCQDMYKRGVVLQLKRQMFLVSNRKSAEVYTLKSY